jgi:glycosyltransferase involved in cell wall biosynthesis
VQHQAEALTRSADPQLVVASEFGRTQYQSGSIALVVNTDFFFITHRLTWALALQAAGAQVTVVAADAGRSSEIREHGLHFREIPFSRDDWSLVRDLRAAASLWSVLSDIQADVCLLIATRAIVIGSIWRLLHPRVRVLLVFTGLGRAFRSMRAPSFVPSALGIWLAGLPRNTKALLQTEEDRDRLLRMHLIRRHSTTVAPGAGVYLPAFQATRIRQQQEETVTVGFASRLFQEKGIYDFVSAARQLSGGTLRFRVAGLPDPGMRTSVSLSELHSWQEEGIIAYDGYQRDMPHWLSGIDIFVLPTYHQEGIPKALIEAAASGCALSTTPLPGCERLVQSGISGVIIPPKRPDTLAEAISDLAADPNRLLTMQEAASELSNDYSLEAILQILFEETRIDDPDSSLAEEASSDRVM